MSDTKTRGRGVTVDERVQIAKMAVEGVAPKHIAERLGLTKSGVASVLIQARKMGLNIPTVRVDAKAMWAEAIAKLRMTDKETYDKIKGKFIDKNRGK